MLALGCGLQILHFQGECVSVCAPAQVRLHRDGRQRVAVWDALRKHARGAALRLPCIALDIRGPCVIAGFRGPQLWFCLKSGQVHTEHMQRFEARAPGPAAGAAQVHSGAAEEARAWRAVGAALRAPAHGEAAQLRAQGALCTGRVQAAWAPPHGAFCQATMRFKGCGLFALSHVLTLK